MKTFGTLAIIIYIVFQAGSITMGQSSYPNLSSKSKKAIEYYATGDQYYVRRDYISAMEWFQKAVNQVSTTRLTPTKG